MVINRIDHFVLTVADIAATCEFYHRVLGMAVLTFGDGRKALGFGDQKINLIGRVGNSNRRRHSQPPAPAISASPPKRPSTT